MATIYTHQSSNITKTWILLSGFFVLIIALGFVFARAYGDPSILYIAVAISIMMNVGSYWWSDKLVLSMVHAKPVDKAVAIAPMATATNPPGKTTTNAPATTAPAPVSKP